ncbi:MAG: ABC transporter substrate-binding protein [Burkholderiales bacterium]|nr:ABC transporter substrate-binding protein [Burkholderiales bacterium]
MRALVAVLLLAIAPLGAAETVTDLAGRSVVLPAKVQRIVLGEGRVIAALAILERDPTQRVVGMMGEFERYDPAGYAQYKAALPAIDRIARVGRGTGESFSIEAALALAPDLAIFGLEGHGPTPKDRETIARLEKAGVAVLFVDFRKEPLANTPRSITLLGIALDRRAEAAAFAGFYQAELQRVSDRLPPAGAPAPTVFIENRVGLAAECCATMANGMMGRFVDFAGGRNIASALIPGSFGTLSLEYLLRNQPAVYIGTAIGNAGASEPPGRIVLGAGAAPEVARASLRRALQRTGIADLAAVRDRRAYAIWHHFYNSPFNVVAVQATAKWLHPQRFADMDPEATLRAAYARFQPVPLAGTYWIGLE